VQPHSVKFGIKLNVRGLILRRKARGSRRKAPAKRLQSSQSIEMH